MNVLIITFLSSYAPDGTDYDISQEENNPENVKRFYHDI